MWKALLESQSGVGPITVFDVSGYPTTIAAEVKDWDVSKVGEDPKIWNYCGRHTRFAVGAAKQAVVQSGFLDSKIDPTRVGVYLGAGEGNQNFSNFTRMVDAAIGGPEFDMKNFLRKGFELMNPREEMEQEPNMPAAHVAALFDAQGPNCNCLTACRCDDRRGVPLHDPSLWIDRL
jgi:3-oxoacyl-[acyl-carrier-protein] synthase II